MKLAEAILLGDSLKKPSASVFLYFTDDGPIGCALGGALIANSVIGKGTRNIIELINEAWPWLVNGQRCMISNMYMELCNSRTVTIEQIADYVKSIEPKEPKQKDTNDASREHQEVLANSL